MSVERLDDEGADRSHDRHAKPKRTDLVEHSDITITEHKSTIARLDYQYRLHRFEEVYPIDENLHIDHIFWESERVQI